MTTTLHPGTTAPPPPWSNNLTCDADEVMCSLPKVPRGDKFFVSCYEDNTYPDNPQYKPCRPLCISGSGEDQDACEYYCPGKFMSNYQPD